MHRAQIRTTPLPAPRILTAARITVALVALICALVAVPACAAESAGAEGKVNVNTAGVSELTLLPRVGPSVAGRILEFREENGLFQAPEDLLLVRGIGEKTFELIEPFITLEGETTLSEKVRVSSLEKKKGKAEER